MPVCPREPTTITEAARSRAHATISWAGSPVRTWFEAHVGLARGHNHRSAAERRTASTPRRSGPALVGQATSSPHIRELVDSHDGDRKAVEDRPTHDGLRRPGRQTNRRREHDRSQLVCRGRRAPDTARGRRPRPRRTRASSIPLAHPPVTDDHEVGVHLTRLVDDRAGSASAGEDISIASSALAEPISSGVRRGLGVEPRTDARGPRHPAGWHSPTARRGSRSDWARR